MKEKGKESQQTKQTHNFLVSIVVFVRESYLFCDSCIKYEWYEYDIKICMNAYKPQKL